jgi:hypothetical protein
MSEDWVVERCSKPFCCKDDAIEYMKEKNFDGMVLELKDGSIQAVCPTYPEGFYDNAKVVAVVEEE